MLVDLTFLAYPGSLRLFQISTSVPFCRTLAPPLNRSAWTHRAVTPAWRWPEWSPAPPDLSTTSRCNNARVTNYCTITSRCLSQASISLCHRRVVQWLAGIDNDSLSLSLTFVLLSSRRERVRGSYSQLFGGCRRVSQHRGCLRVRHEVRGRIHVQH